MGVSKPVEALGEKAFGPFAHDAPLDTDQLGHGGLGVTRSQQQDKPSPPREPCGQRGRSLPTFQGLPLGGRQDNA